MKIPGQMFRILMNSLYAWSLVHFFSNTKLANAQQDTQKNPQENSTQSLVEPIVNRKGHSIIDRNRMLACKNEDETPACLKNIPRGKKADASDEVNESQVENIDPVGSSSTQENVLKKKKRVNKGEPIGCVKDEPVGCDGNSSSGNVDP